MYLSRNNTRLRNIFLAISFSVKRLSELSDFSPLWVSAVLRFDELKTPLILHVCWKLCFDAECLSGAALLYSFPKRFILNSFFIFDSNLRSIAILTFGFFSGVGIDVRREGNKGSRQPWFDYKPEGYFDMLWGEFHLIPDSLHICYCKSSTGGSSLSRSGH